MSLLKAILQKKQVFLDLLKLGNPSLLQWHERTYIVVHMYLRVVLVYTDCLFEHEKYQDAEKMRVLLNCRQKEFEAIYHDKKLIDVLVTMSHKLEEHMTGKEITLRETGSRCSKSPILCV